MTLTFDLWPWPFTWTSLLSLVITPENFMMIRWWERSQKGVTDGRTDRRTDGQTENTICRAAWSQLKNPQWRMRRSPAYIETPQIRLPSAVNISHQNIRGVLSEHTQNFIYPSLKCKWPIHTKLLAPNDLISLSYRTQYCVWNDNVYYELKKKIDWNILVLPDQCSRTFWASSRYRYRDTISMTGSQHPFQTSNSLVT